MCENHEKNESSEAATLRSSGFFESGKNKTKSRAKRGKPMYSFNSRVRYSEVNKDGRLKLVSLLDYFQDCSTFHSEDAGMGTEYLAGQGLAWVLNFWQIDVMRYPQLCEQITIETCPYAFKGCLGFRNFDMLDEQGNRIAVANTLWTLLNLQSMRPAKPTEEMLQAYSISSKLPMEYLSRKIPVEGEGERQDEVLVRKHHLDTNYHMNNGQYVAVASDLLPENFEVNRLMVSYHKSAVLGDILYPVIYGKGTEEVTVVLETEEHSPYAIVKFNGILSKQENRVPVVGKIL